jgi:hypothetical protein
VQTGLRDGFKSMTLRMSMRSNQSRITAADIKYLSLPKRKGFEIIEVNLVHIQFC